MPIQLIDNEYAVTVTYKCNWSCEYCAIRNKHDYKPNLTHEDVLEKLKLIPENSNVTIFGGEPGLVEREKMEIYIQFLNSGNRQLFLETNGTFIERYPDLIKNFKEVLYHCSQDLDDEIIDCSKFNNIRYLIIVHDKNIHRLDNYLNRYQKIKFDIIEATYPYPEMKGPTLSRQNKNHIITKFGNRMTKESFKRLLNGKDFNKITFLT